MNATLPGSTPFRTRFAVPTSRIRRLNDHAPRRDGRFVLYEMTAQRRAHSNFALDRALEWARRLDRPVLVLEALSLADPWASPRLHGFVIQGMLDNAAAFRQGNVAYYPFVERQVGAGRGMVEALAKRASVVVTDDYPDFFQPFARDGDAARLDVACEAVDSVGLQPFRAAGKDFKTARSFRRWLQRELPAHLPCLPDPDPLGDPGVPADAELPAAITARWPATGLAELADPAFVGTLPLAHDVPRVESPGGARQGLRQLDDFLRTRLERYAEARNSLDADPASGLSWWLHFGHVASADVLRRIAQREDWSPDCIPDAPCDGRRGWLGLSPEAEAFLDQLVTWRELGFNFCAHRADYRRYESLPAWALETLADHARDRRPYLYDLEELDEARTHDALWNAAQRQLTSEGRMHNYLRMLWGKKILEWSPTPRTALGRMIELNNRYAVDGRDPNSYSGIFWVLGRYDRPWGPERPIFGKIRYMSSENTARKMRVAGFMARYAGKVAP